MLVTSEIEKFLKKLRGGDSCLVYTFWDEDPYIHNAWARLSYNSNFPNCFMVDIYYQYTCICEHDPVCVNIFRGFKVETLSAEEILHNVDEICQEFKSAANRMIERIMHYLDTHGVKPFGHSLSFEERYSFPFAKAWRGGKISVGCRVYDFGEMRPFFFNRIIEELEK